MHNSLTRESSGHSLPLRIAPLLCAFILFVGATVWGAWRDVIEVRNSTLVAEAYRLRTHADRTASRIEAYLEAHPEETFSRTLELSWLNEHWDKPISSDQPPLFVALVNLDGAVIYHSNGHKAGLHLEPHWYSKTIEINDLEIITTASEVLGNGQMAYAIQVPIAPNYKIVGYCYVGMDADMLDQAVASSQSKIIMKWAVIAAVMFLTLILAYISTLKLARESTSLKQAIAMQHVQQLTELGRLAGGLAHEIRNPLNAIRLNLFTLKKQLERDADKGAQASASELLRETDLEVERLEDLIRSVLGYARPSEGTGETTNAVGEINSTVHFVEGMMEKDGITLTKTLPRDNVIVRIDQDRFRQMLLNLLNNAREVSKGGKISIELSNNKKWAYISISDSGPGVPEEAVEKVFEPFYTTKEDGTGLGLAIVRRFATQVGGNVICEPGNGSGATFRITLPLTRQRTSK